MSDILIKGMEMPKERKMFVIEPDGSVWIQIADTSYFCTGSKAIELPEHGDLIDKQELLKLNNITYVYTGYWATDFEAVKTSVIENAPVIVEANYGTDN